MQYIAEINCLNLYDINDKLLNIKCNIITAENAFQINFILHY